MSNAIANETLRQLGGARFVKMTGAKDFFADRDGSLWFRVPNAAKGIARVRVALVADLYTIEFHSRDTRRNSGRVVATEAGLYSDQLAPMFEKHTGLYTKF